MSDSRPGSVGKRNGTEAVPNTSTAEQSNEGVVTERAANASRKAAVQQVHRSLKAWLDPGLSASDGEMTNGPVNEGQTPTVQRKIFRASDDSSDDTWRRQPDSLQEQMALDAAKAGAGDVIIPSLNDPRYRGMSKKEYKVTSKEGAKVCVHYVFDPKTGKSMDFKFKETRSPPGIGRKAID